MLPVQLAMIKNQRLAERLPWLAATSLIASSVHTRCLQQAPKTGQSVEVRCFLS